VPTYQYACTECGQQLEAVQSFSDPALTDCPACRGRLRKVFNSVGIVFKGSGFYRNDSRNGKAKDEGANASPPESKPESPKSDAANNSSAAGSGTGGTAPAPSTAKAATPA
jgi:putative FmdB family regulatory protein